MAWLTLASPAIAATRGFVSIAVFGGPDVKRPRFIIVLHSLCFRIKPLVRHMAPVSRRGRMIYERLVSMNWSNRSCAARWIPAARCVRRHQLRLRHNEPTEPVKNVVEVASFVLDTKTVNPRGQGREDGMHFKSRQMQADACKRPRADTASWSPGLRKTLNVCGSAIAIQQPDAMKRQRAPEPVK